MKEQDPLFFLTDSAQVTVRLSSDLTYLMEVPRVALLFRHLARIYFKEDALFDREDIAVNKQKLSEIREKAQILIEREVRIDKELKIRAKKYAAVQAAIDSIVEN